MTIAAEPEIQQSTFVFYDVSWDVYTKLLKAVGEQNVRLTYDEGALEIMSPLPEHENVKTLIGNFVESLAVELNVPIRCLGSTTFHSKALLKGLEPDECYYVQHEAEVRGKRRLDLRRDPPPDLVIEVDISYRTLDKRRIYSAMRVPEIWSYDSGKLQCLHLRRGKYVARDVSSAFPSFRPSVMEPFLQMLAETDDMSIMRAWRDWLTRNLAEE